MKTITPNAIIAKKNIEKIVMITAYDALFAKLFDEYVDIILVGDSLNMSFNGQKDTINIGMREMIYHTRAVKNGAKHAMVILDMPFGAVSDKKTALKNSIKAYKKSGCDAIKIEGGADKADLISHLTKNAIAVCGHIGLKPQMVRFEGGYKVKGRGGEAEISALITDAKALEKAGVFAIVVEGTLSSVAEKIAKSVQVPVIGIGSGVNVDGQVLVWSDMLGFFEEFHPKFAKTYLDGASIVKKAVQNYADEVRNSIFPSKEFEYKE
ncbi:3-methyl-2-oxobutanoate hydroxymethyltransferase [Campylobacter hominis]|uniref:3-methyl-2-oxobutanoate hydroxymethyltransferase n=1 Tax=Campylobacter hominis TaxID=76517 RepID=UPI00248C0489|nr:3-methyl-2-oxobutanoate hydroxymethyltransferase [Campylobacter hominis]